MPLRLRFGKGPVPSGKSWAGKWCLLLVPAACAVGLLALSVSGIGRPTTRLQALSGAFAGLRAMAVHDPRLHRRVFTSYSNRLVQGMDKADQDLLARALSDGNRAYDRARWRYGLMPVELGIVIDGVEHRFLSDEILFNRYRRNYLDLRDSSSFGTRGEFLPWEMFRSVQYDQLPRPLGQLILQLQIDRYRRYLQPSLWPGIGVQEWRTVPDPVLKIAAYRMVRYWAGIYAPEGMRREEAARIVASIGRVESLFDLDKMVHRDPATGRADLGFLQISEPLRRRLRGLSEFRDCSDSDFLKPWVSIRAGAYSFFSIFLEGAGGDVLEAIGHYNAGRHGPRERAEEYLEAVAGQFQRAFVRRTYSPTLRFILMTAHGDYVRGVEEDRLYAAQRSQSASKGKR
ncbi:MAG: transglycosylase SLT domain-containing protein [Acidobacteria bacterium]|nr:transglycosylase SLT domain-containing protein [Acidobacteriota bacterium]